MAMLESVLRLKQMRRSQQLQELARLNARLAQHESELTLARRREEDARGVLWQVISAEDSLCVQRLAFARAQDEAAQIARGEAVQVRDACTREITLLTDALVQLEKQIEKLMERVERERRRKSLEALRQEWRAMDERVVNRCGAGR